MPDPRGLHKVRHVDECRGADRAIAAIENAERAGAEDMIKRMAREEIALMRDGMRTRRSVQCSLASP